MKSEFYKIQIFDQITNGLINFGMQSVNPELQDYVDLNCGAIPPGDFEQVIDPDAVEQFIFLYEGIVQKRFAFTVMSLINANAIFENAIADYMCRAGKNMNFPPVNSKEEKQNIIQSFIFAKEPESAWKAANGSIKIYYKMIQSFVDGLLFQSDFKISVFAENKLDK